MKRKRYRFVVVCLVLVVIMLGACQKNKKKENDDKSGKKDGILIGFSFDSFSVERWKKDCDVFVSKIKDYDSSAEVNVQNANGSKKKQESQIQYLIDKKVDVLVIVSIDSESIKNVVKKAKKAGIKVIAYDRRIKGVDVDLYISFDNYEVGRKMGKALYGSGLKHKKVMMLLGPKEDNNVSMVEKGFRSVMEKNGIEICDCYNVEGWNPEDAANHLFELYENNHNVFDDIDGIMCGNDAIVTGAVNELAEHQIGENIKFVGQDAELEACQRIVNGTQLMTVYKPVGKLAEEAAKYAIKMAKGEECNIPMEKDDELGEDEKRILLETIAVDKTNIDSEIIDSGFHLKQDVYMYSSEDEIITEKSIKNGN